MRAENPRESGVAILSNHAHTVLLHRDSKRPMWEGWIKRRPSPDTAIRHVRAGGAVGLIPESAGLMVVDVDRAGAAYPIGVSEPLLVVPTPRGEHQYYPWDGRDYDEHHDGYDIIRRGMVKLWQPYSVARLVFSRAW